MLHAASIITTFEVDRVRKGALLEQCDRERERERDKDKESTADMLVGMPSVLAKPVCTMQDCCAPKVLRVWKNCNRPDPLFPSSELLPP